VVVVGRWQGSEEESAALACAQRGDAIQDTRDVGGVEGTTVEDGLRGGVGYSSGSGGG
jgi:hypothetical protein